MREPGRHSLTNVSYKAGKYYLDKVHLRQVLLTVFTKLLQTAALHPHQLQSNLWHCVKVTTVSLTAKHALVKASSFTGCLMYQIKFREPHYCSKPTKFLWKVSYRYLPEIMLATFLSSDLSISLEFIILINLSSTSTEILQTDNQIDQSFLEDKIKRENKIRKKFHRMSSSQNCFCFWRNQT